MAMLRIAKVNPFKILRKLLKAFSQKNAPCNGIESIYEVNFETNVQNTPQKPELF